MGARQHTAILSGNKQTYTRTQWAVHLEMSTARLEKLMIQHGDMQTVIDKEMGDKLARKAAARAFLMRPRPITTG